MSELLISEEKLLEDPPDLWRTKLRSTKDGIDHARQEAHCFSGDVIGVGWGAYAFAHDGYMREQWDDLLPLLSSGRLTPLVSRECRLEDVPDVLRAMESRTQTGKAVAVLG